MRTPLLPFRELLDLAADVEAPDAPDDPSALERDRELLRGRLERLVERPDAREAIFVSSPALEELIDVWVADPESPRGRQCERALVRFAARMTARSTPFGLFAGVSTGAVGETTRLEIAGHDTYRRHTRLDAGYLVDVLDGLLAERDLREGVAYRPNPSLYRVGDRWRYVRSRPGAEEERHLLVSVRASGALERSLQAAATGATPSELGAAVSANGAEPEQAQRYVDDLIQRQVLVPDLELQVTDADATYGLAGWVPPLAAARDELAALDAEELGVPSQRYRRIASILDELPAEQKLERLFQVDLTKASPRATLGRDVVDELLRGIELWRRVGATKKDDRLERFAERFQQRFEGRAVPLLEALDPDLGVSVEGEDVPTAPLLAGLGVAYGEPRPTTWGRREDCLLARLLEVQAAGDQELALDARDLEQLQAEDPLPLPDAFAAMAVVAARSEHELAKGRFRVLVLDADGPSGARLLGRFCHADPALRAAVDEHLRAEEALDPDAVFAEIVHLSRARDVNVIARPRLRDFELVCLGGSAAPPERRLGLDDLLVAIEGGRVVLRSRRLGRRVVPRLTSAHNYAYRGMAVYQFLCRLQRQGHGGGRSFWGPLASSPFLPRIRSGRIVLQRASWSLDAGDLGTRGDRDGEFRAVQEWRRSRRLPRFVALADPGLELPVDLDNVLAVESLAQAVRVRGTARIAELFPPAGELCAHGPEGAFLHELVVPFVRSRPPARAPQGQPADGPVRRTFPPGADWLYARIYTGELIADGVLAEHVAPLVRELTGSNVVDRWFFLRYRDPEFHLRVRFHGDPGDLQATARPALDALGAELVDLGLAWRIELGTYEREVERYGGSAAMELAERIFHADSDAVLAILPMLEPGDAGQEERWRLGLYGVHRLLLDLGFDEAERLALVRSHRGGLVRTLAWDGAVLGRIGERFRRERAALERLLDSDPAETGPLKPGLDVLQERSRAVEPIGRELAALSSEGRLTTPLQSVAGSLVHMHLNRLLRGDNTSQEAVICDFLVRLYEGRARKASKRS